MIEALPFVVIAVALVLWGRFENRELERRETAAARARAYTDRLETQFRLAATLGTLNSLQSPHPWDLP